MNDLKKPIDNVKVDILDVALRYCGIILNKTILDKIIDIVELIEEKGEKATLKDISKLKSEW